MHNLDFTKFKKTDKFIDVLPMLGVLALYSAIRALHFAVVVAVFFALVQYAIDDYLVKEFVELVKIKDKILVVVFIILGIYIFRHYTSELKKIEQVEKLYAHYERQI